MIKLIFISKSFLFFLLLIILNFTHHFISTGCVVSPLPFTCFGDSVIWGKDIEVIKGLSIWLEQWAKAGAGPNFRVENINEYISNIRWVSHWFEKYFLVKFLDQLGLLIATFFTVFLFLKKFKFTNSSIVINKNIYYFYALIVLIFCIWFFKHPTLRYGGYPVIFFILSIPVSIFFDKFEKKKFLNKNIIYLVTLVFILFNLKNISRINKEFARGDIYKFNNFPFFSIENKKFSTKKIDSNLTLFSAHHCWATPSPCGQIGDDIYVMKRKGYYFIYQYK